MITHALHVALLGNGATPHEILESMAWKLEVWFCNILEAWGRRINYCSVASSPEMAKEFREELRLKILGLTTLEFLFLV